MRRLIVNADDFGLCPGTVTGIMRGWRRGIITSTSLMFTVSASMAAAQAARFHPQLDVGVHLTFVEGHPVLAPEWVPSLVNEQGRFLSSQEWLTAGRRPLIKELRAEFRAQIALALQAGLRITHLDLHTAAGYLMPEVFELTVHLAKHYGLAIRYPFGEGWEDIASDVANRTGLPLPYMRQIVAYYQQLVADQRIAHPDRFMEAFPSDSEGRAEALANRIRTLGEGTTEFLTHPAFFSSSRKYLGREAAARRAAELAALCDPRVRQAVQEAGVELVNFRQL